MQPTPGHRGKETAQHTAGYQRRHRDPYRPQTPPRDHFRVGQDHTYHPDIQNLEYDGHRHRGLDYEPPGLSDRYTDEEYDAWRHEPREERHRSKHRDPYNRDYRHEHESTDYSDYYDDDYDHELTVPKRYAGRRHDPYHSDPESGDDRRAQTRDYWVPRHSRDNYVDDDTFASRYLTQTGPPEAYSGGYSNQGYVAGVGGGDAAADIFNTGVGIGSQSQGIQNVPQMSTQGIQYALPGPGAQHPPQYSTYGIGTGTGAALAAARAANGAGYTPYYSTHITPSVATGPSGEGARATAITRVQGRQTSTGACPVCRGHGYHTHGDYVYYPQAVPVVTPGVTPGVTPAVVPGSAMYLAPSSDVRAGAMMAAPAQG